MVRIVFAKREGGGKVKDYCDSCTEEVEVKPYQVDAITFYWCDNCKEEEA